MIPGTFLILFTLFIIYACFGLYTLFINIYSLKNRMLFSICIHLSLWALGSAFMITAPNKSVADFWRLISAFGWCFIYSVCLDFFILVRFEKSKWMSRIERLFIYMPSLFFLLSNFKYDSSKVIIRSGNIWKSVHLPNLLHSLFNFYYIAYISIGIFIIYKWGKNSVSKTEKKQAKIIIVTSAITFSIIAVIYIVLPFFNIDIFYLGVIAFSISLYGMWYAITKYKMMKNISDVAGNYILENMNDPVILIDNKLLIKEANHAAVKISGFGRTEIKGMPIGSIIIENTNQDKEIIEKLSKEKQIKNLEVRLCTKNKEYISCLFSAAAVNDDIGENLGIVCIFHDITDRKNAEKILKEAHQKLETEVQKRTYELKKTNILLEEEIYERKRTEEELKSSEEKYKALMKQSTSGILIVATDTLKVIESNKEVCNILGYTENELSGLTVDKFTHFGIEEIEKKLATLTGNEDEIIKRTTTARRKDGTLRNVEISITLIGYDNKNFIVISVTDITEKLLMNERKQQMAKMESLGTLAGGIAHDFNNILAGIIGYTQLSIENAEESLPLEDDLLEILKLGERAKKLISQILTFSRKNMVQPKIVDMKDIIEGILKMIKTTINSSVEIKYNYDVTSANVFADPGEMQQLMMNLCINAELAVRDRRGILQVRLSEVIVNMENELQYENVDFGKYIEIQVIDNGCGMERDTMERIFEPFFTTRGVQGGTGLGLSVVHGIVKRYKGLIKVYSEPDKGSIFTVVLPEAVECSNNELADNDIFLKGSAHILFVDDEESIVNTSRSFLQNAGYTVTGVLSGEKALELFKKNKDSFDIIITDQSMPDITGEALIEELRAVRRDIPVILCSGYNYEIDGCNISSTAITEFLLKPISKSEYINTIEKIMNRK